MGANAMTQAEIGKRIAEERKAQGISIRELAERASTSTRAVQAVEKGWYNVGIDTYLKIAEALGLDLTFKNETTMEKQRIFNKIMCETNMGNSIPSVINGGGFSWVCNDAEDFIKGISGEDYADPMLLKKGEEFADFKDFLSGEEYEEMTFYVFKHRNGYNQENNDVQVGIY